MAHEIFNEGEGVMGHLNVVTSNGIALQFENTSDNEDIDLYIGQGFSEFYTTITQDDAKAIISYLQKQIK